jgi:hypothetical protein
MSYCLLSVHWHTFYIKHAAKILKLCHITKQFVLNKVFLSIYFLPFARKCLILQAKFLGRRLLFARTLPLPKLPALGNEKKN